MKVDARSHHKRADGAVNFEDGAMANMKEGRDQLSVAIDPELRAAIERAAKAEHRTVSGQVRHIVAKALENQAQAA
jgi:hypothetical protein